MPRINLPITRYYGSKRKLIERIWTEFDNLNLEFDSILDVFGGSATFSYYAKRKQKNVIYNDIFKFNHIVGKALIEADQSPLTLDQTLSLLEPQRGICYKSIICDNFHDIYYTDDENQLIDIVVQNIELIEDEISRASAYFVLFQSCLIKRPFNLFHRKNLSLRTNHVQSNFGNKKTWEHSFRDLFVKFHTQITSYQFNNTRNNISVNHSALNCNFNADLVYIDPPYINLKNSHVSYHSRYHFLEGLANYNSIENFISNQKNNNEILINKNPEFETKANFIDDLSNLIAFHSNSIIVISYRSGGHPTIEEIYELLCQYKNPNNVHIIDLGNYSYALNRNNINNKEYLIIGA